MFGVAGGVKGGRQGPSRLTIQVISKTSVQVRVRDRPFLPDLVLHRTAVFEPDESLSLALHI